MNTFFRDALSIWSRTTFAAGVLIGGFVSYSLLSSMLSGVLPWTYLAVVAAQWLVPSLLLFFRPRWSLSARLMAGGAPLVVISVVAYTWVFQSAWFI